MLPYFSHASRLFPVPVLPYHHSLTVGPSIIVVSGTRFEMSFSLIVTQILGYSVFRKDQFPASAASRMSFHDSFEAFPGVRGHVPISKKFCSFEQYVLFCSAFPFARSMCILGKTAFSRAKDIRSLSCMKPCKCGVPFSPTSFPTIIYSGCFTSKNWRSSASAVDG